MLLSRSKTLCARALPQRRLVHGLGPFPNKYHVVPQVGPQDYTSRNFNYFMVANTGVIGTAMAKNAIGNFIASLTPGRHLMAVANLEVDLDQIPQGQSVTLEYRGKPLFVRHRTDEEIEQAQNTPLSELPDPQTDADRAKDPNYLIVLGVCTHLGCVPLGQKGSYNGWFCPCHGSHYDTSARIRAGPAPKNLEVPPYKFLKERPGNWVLVGEED